MDKGFSGGGGGSSGTPRLDMKGVPFSKPCVNLPYTEWKDVSGAIADEYDTKYKGKQWAHKSMNGKTYYFENRRFGDINIYKVIDDE